MSDSLAIAEIIRLREEIDKLRQNHAANWVGLSTIKTRNDANVIIAKAIEAAHAAYWAACDAEGRPVDPADLDAPAGFFEELYRTAQTVEGILNERGITWAEARKLIDEDLLRHKIED